MTSTNLNTNDDSLTKILKENLVQQVKKYLHDNIDKDIEDIARDSVVRFIEIEINNQRDLNMRDELIFNFVNKITEIKTREVVLKEKDKE